MSVANPLHIRLKKLSDWQRYLFMMLLCERMYPNYLLFCQQNAQRGDAELYRSILNLTWEFLLVKKAKIDFDKQLEKFETIIPSAGTEDIYAVYPAIDACVALTELLHACMTEETLEYAVSISRASVNSVAMLEMNQLQQELVEEELAKLPTIILEFDIQWELYNIILEQPEFSKEFIKEIRSEIKENGMSNIGVILTNNW